jgi:hypothetical protein
VAGVTPRIRASAAAVLALALVLSTGCAVRNSRTITGIGQLSATPPGPTAVLSVTAVPHVDPRTGQLTWGLINTPNVEARFDEFLASAADHDAGLDVIEPIDVEQRLLAAHLKPTLQPDEKQLDDFAHVLGLGSYLVAHVERSRLQYRFFWSWSDVQFTVSCYAVGSAQPVWQAHVKRTVRSLTDRQAIALSLREMFRWLKDRQLPPDGGEYTE